MSQAYAGLINDDTYSNDERAEVMIRREGLSTTNVRVVRSAASLPPISLRNLMAVISGFPYDNMRERAALIFHIKL